MELSGHLDFAVVLQKKKKRISNRENKKKIERGGKEVRGVPSARGKRELWGGGRGGGQKNRHLHFKGEFAWDLADYGVCFEVAPRVHASHALRGRLERKDIHGLRSLGLGPAQKALADLLLRRNGRHLIVKSEWNSDARARAEAAAIFASARTARPP